MTVGNYLITDHITYHYIEFTTDRNDANKTITAEPLIVTAVSPSQLAKEAFSALYPDDIIHYEIDSASWGSLEHPDSKGRITYREDTIKDISLPQDFRNCVFRRWSTDLSTWNGEAVSYCLWNTSVSLGMSGAGLGNVAITLAALDVEDYTDHFTFDNYSYAKHDINLKVEGRWWERVNPLINIVIKGTENYWVEGGSCYYSHFEGSLKRFKTYELGKIINTRSQTQATASQAADISCWGGGQFTYFVSNLFIGSYNFGNMNSTLTGSTMHPVNACKRIRIYNINTVDNVYFSYDGGFADGSYSEMNHLVNTKMVTLKNVMTDSLRSISIIGLNMLMISYENWDGGTYLSCHKSVDMLSLPLEFNKEAGISTIPTTIAAVSAISFGRGLTDIELIAGTLNLTGSGTVNLATINPNKGYYATSIFPMELKRVLKPAAGLVKSIAYNNVAFGFLNKTTITADGDLGEVIVIEPVMSTDNQLKWIARN